MKELALDTGPVEWVGASHVVTAPAGWSPRRLPAEYEPQFDMMTAMAANSPSGVRLAFRTDATEIEVTSTPMIISDALPSGGKDVEVWLPPFGDMTVSALRVTEGASVGAAGDAHIHYLDGLELFGPDDVHDLPDDLHPNGDGYERIGERFASLVFGPDGVVPAAALA